MSGPLARFCSNCHKANRREDRFCAECGCQQGTKIAMKHSSATATLFACLLALSIIAGVAGSIFFSKWHAVDRSGWAQVDANMAVMEENVDRYEQGLPPIREMPDLSAIPDPWTITYAIPLGIGIGAGLFILICLGRMAFSPPAASFDYLAPRDLAAPTSVSGGSQ
jgi:hypothetical protein